MIGEGIMTFEQVMNVIYDLAQTRDFYRHYYYSIKDMEQNSPEEFAYFKADMEGQQFTDITDIINYFES